MVAGSPKILMIATHPRSTSTALERAFLTRKDIACVHEPFGEPFYYGPERLSDRYPSSECQKSQYKDTNFKSVADEILEARPASASMNKENVDANVHASGGDKEDLIVIKDMAQYIIPPKNHKLADKTNIVAPSFTSQTSGSVSKPSPESLNPTLLPDEFLESMNYVFLIRPPHLSIPSYYKCCIPPQSKETGFDHYRCEEAGLRELRILYDYICERADSAAKLNSNSAPRIKKPMVVDSLDLMANPEQIISRICDQGGFPFDKKMLSWGQNAEYEVQMFEKWKGFHNDALNSTGFDIKHNGGSKENGTAKASGNGTTQASGDANGSDKKGLASKNDDFKVDYPAWEKKWKEKFNNDEAIVQDIRKSVEQHLDDYLYLRQFRETV